MCNRRGPALCWAFKQRLFAFPREGGQPSPLLGVADRIAIPIASQAARLVPGFFGWAWGWRFRNQMGLPRQLHSEFQAAIWRHNAKLFENKTYVPELNEYG